MQLSLARFVKLVGLCCGVVIFAMICVPGAVTSAIAQTYTFTPVDVGDGSACTRTTRIDDKGIVTGGYFPGGVCNAGQQGCFARYPNGPKIEIFGEAYDVCAGAGINDKGVITGIVGNTGDDCQFGGTQTLGFVRQPGGEPITFDADPPSSVDTTGRSINNKGEVAGFYADSSCVNHGFVRRKQNKITLLDIAGAGTGSNQGTYIYGINDSGTVTGTYIDGSGGYHGFVVTGAGGDPGKHCGKSCQVYDFDIPSSKTLAANHINNNGTVVGTYTDANDVVHGFMRTSDGAITMIDDPDAGTAASQGTVVYSISDGKNGDDGDLVGLFLNGSGQHGFVWSAKGKFTTIDYPMANQTGAYDINSKGYVTGDWLDTDGHTHGYIAVPAK